MPGTGLFNEGLDDLAATLATISGMRVVRDPRNISPGCILIGAPTFTAFNYNIAQMSVPVQIISSGPGNQDALDQLLTLASQLLTKNVAVTEGRPTSLDIGGTIVPGYDLMVEMQVQTA
jgi:hypothetical protein